MKLAGTVAMVTGAGRGIGREIALMQAREGAKVALLSRTAAEIDAVAAEILDEGNIARAYPIDIVDLAAVGEVVAAVEAELGSVSLVTNNAAVFTAVGPIWEVDPAAWWRDVEITVRGSFNVCRTVLPRMMARRRGRIINMTGGGTASSLPHGSGYATGKAGILRFTESISDTLAGTGICMFAMDPGLVKTAMNDRHLSSKAGRTYFPDLAGWFERGINVPPTLAALLTVEIAVGRFDKLAGRMLMAARGDLDLMPEAVDEIVASDLRSLRVNGMPPERPHAWPGRL